MKKRIALAAIAALAGGLLVAAPASAASPNYQFTADLSASNYVVGQTVCFYATDPATYSWDGTSAIDTTTLGSAQHP